MNEWINMITQIIIKGTSLFDVEYLRSGTDMN